MNFICLIILYALPIARIAMHNLKNLIMCRRWTKTLVQSYTSYWCLSRLRVSFPKIKSHRIPCAWSRSPMWNGAHPIAVSKLCNILLLKHLITWPGNRTAKRRDYPGINPWTTDTPILLTNSAANNPIWSHPIAHGTGLQSKQADWT